MFDGTFRHQQSIFKIKVLPILRRTLDCLFHEGLVLRWVRRRTSSTVGFVLRSHGRFSFCDQHISPLKQPSRNCPCGCSVLRLNKPRSSAEPHPPDCVGEVEHKATALSLRTFHERQPIMTKCASRPCGCIPFEGRNVPSAAVRGWPVYRQPEIRAASSFSSRAFRPAGPFGCIPPFGERRRWPRVMRPSSSEPRSR